MQTQKNFSRSIFIILLILCFIVVATVFKLTASFVLPLIAAALLSFVFYPQCKFLTNKLHFPWILSILTILFFTLGLLYIIGNLLVTSSLAIIKEYSKYESRFTSLYKLFCETFKIEFDDTVSLLENLWNLLNIKTIIQNMAIPLSTWLVSTGKVLLVMLLFVLFLLIEMRTMKKKVSIAFPDKTVKEKIHTMSSNIIHEVTHYLSIKFFISLITGGLVGIATALIDMDFPIMWAFVAFVLNFIPNFGSIISWAITTLFALLQFWPSWGRVAYVAISVILINTILGNIIEPRWEGSDLGLSPFVILVSLFFWGWMWGFAGMILAVPLMVIIKIICENVALLKPIAVLLGNSHH